MPLLPLAVDDNCIAYVACETASDMQRAYNQYQSVADDDTYFTSGVHALVVDDFEGNFVQKELCKTGCGSAVSSNDRSVIFMACQGYQRFFLPRFLDLPT